LTRQKSDVDLALKKSNMVKIVSVLINQAGNHLMKIGQGNEASFKVTDLVNLIKTHQLLSGEATERFGIYDKEMVKEMVKEMTPAERGIILTLFDKIDQKVKTEESEKESTLKLVN
jgi:hypothetical protein